MDLVSIVIPVYNTGEPLRDCLDSVLTQTYGNLEVLLVDDHSTDQVTLDILQEYVRKDKRFTLLTSAENNGVSTSRNIAINHATGAYITFLDSDDCFVPDFVEKMLKAVQDNHTDFAVCNGKNFVLDESVLLEDDLVFPLPETSRVECKDFIQNKYLTKIPIVPWAKLINLQKLKEHKLYFLEEMTTAGDHDWCFRLFCSLDSFSVVNFWGIKRLLRQGSLTHTINLDRLIKHVKSNFLKTKIIREYGLFDIYGVDCFNFCCHSLVESLNNADSKEVINNLLSFADEEFKNLGFKVNLKPSFSELILTWLKYKISAILVLKKPRVIYRALYKLYKTIRKVTQLSG